MPSPPPVLSHTSSSNTSTASRSTTKRTFSSSPKNVHTNQPKGAITSGYHRSPEQNFHGENEEEYEEDFGRVEFEVPLSADAELERLHYRNKLAQQARARASESRFSIDFSLELERELAMESPPVTPTHDALVNDTSVKKVAGSNMVSPLRNSLSASTAADSEDGDQSMSQSDSNPDFGQHANNTGSPPSISNLSPDPVILAHIITQLRQSLDEMTKERDGLIQLLAKANTQEASAKDALQLMTDKATEAQEELEAAKRKMKEDEEQIAMLRGKVEESRRGLMRLQTESRRQSMAPIDISRTNSLTLGAFASPPNTSKRASFTPLTGTFNARVPTSSGHRRVSSVSSVSDPSLVDPTLPSPNASTTALNIAAAEAALTGTAPPSSTKRFSGLFGRTSPQPPLSSSEGDAPVLPSSTPSVNPAEVESLKKEVTTLKDRLDTVKHELLEVTEAKEASEVCVRALRDFIAENNVGVSKSLSAASSIKLPPPPLMASGDEPSVSDAKKTASGWGFRIWGASTSNDAAPTMPQSASVQGSSPPSVASTSSYGPVPQSAGVAAGPPLSRKLGGFFSSRSASISSQHSVTNSISGVPAPPPLSKRASSAASTTSASGAPVRLDFQRDSYTNSSISDGSSVVEPVSPGTDVHGLGSGTYFNSKDARERKISEEDGEMLPETFVVRDVTHLDRVRDVQVDSLKGIAPVGSVDAGINSLH